jgi:hypothetical protein
MRHPIPDVPDCLLQQYLSFLLQLTLPHLIPLVLLKKLIAFVTVIAFGFLP